MVATEKDSHADAPRDSMTTRTSGLVKAAQLEPSHQTKELHVSHNQHVPDMDNTQEMPVTAGHADNANKDG